MRRRRLRSSAGRTAVLYLDLDGFKAINDLYGHAAGDALLREVSERLGSAVDKRVFAGRLGGDEFAVFLTDVTEEECLPVRDRPDRAHFGALRPSARRSRSPSGPVSASRWRRNMAIPPMPCCPSPIGVSMPPNDWERASIGFSTRASPRPNRRSQQRAETRDPQRNRGVRAALPTDRQSRHRSHRRAGSAAALATSVTRAGPRRRFHCPCRRERTDGSLGRVGDPAGLP